MKRFLLSLCCLFGAIYLNAQTTLNASWLKGFGSNGNDLINNSCVDASGNIYLVGKISGSVDLDPGPGQYTVSPVMAQAFFAKYNSGGNLIWARALDGTAKSNGNAIVTDANGDVIVVGSFDNGVIDFNPSVPNTNTLTANDVDMFMLKYTSTGAFSTVQAITSATCDVKPKQLRIDGSGNIIVTGDFFQDPASPVNFNPAGPSFTMNTVGNRDGFIAKYNSSWQLMFAIPFGSVNNDYVNGVEVDATNNIYVAGIVQANHDFDPTAPTASFVVNGSEAIYIAKYSSTGGFLWLDGFSGTGMDGGYRLKLDNNNDLLVYAYMSSPVIDADPTANTQTLSLVGSPGSYNAFLGKYNSSNGSLIWAKNTGGIGGLGMTPFALTTDAANNIYLSGYFQGIVDFDFDVVGVNNYTSVTVSGNDIYLTKLNPNGNFIFNYTFGGNTGAGHEGNQLHILSGNTIFLGGTISSQIDLDPSIASNSVPYVNGTDIFFSTYTQCITADTPTLSINNATICANGVVTLSIASGSLNSATNWIWALSCGGSTVATGPTATFSPVFATTYFVRGEGGCPTPSNCASATVAVTPSKDVQGQALTSSTVPVSGYVVLYKYKGPLHIWDSVTYQNINPSGNYTFTSVNSGSYILTCEPTSSSLQITYAPSAVSWKGAIPFTHGCNVNTNTNINVIPLTNIGSGPGELSGKITEGLGYGHKGTFAPGNPIGGISIKGGKNPGGNIIAQGRTNSSGEYTLSSLPLTGPGESYFIMVDIPGLDTNGTYHMAIVTGSTQYSGLDFIVDSMYINPTTGVGMKELNIDDQLVNIFPNPAKDQLTIKIKGNNNATVHVKLFDLFGKLIKEERQEQVIGEYTSQIALQDLSRGIYFVKIRINDSERTIKLILSE